MTKPSAAKTLALVSALTKLRTNPGVRTGGRLTPAELLALMNFGAKADNPRAREHALARIAAGDHAPSWHYVTMSKRLRAMLRGP